VTFVSQIAEDTSPLDLATKRFDSPLDRIGFFNDDQGHPVPSASCVMVWNEYAWATPTEVGMAQQHPISGVS